MRSGFILVPARCEENRNHCWHETGDGWSYGTGMEGADYVKCCHCGRGAERMWQMRTERIPGHGPHATHKVKESGPAVTRMQAEGARVEIRPVEVSGGDPRKIWDEFYREFARQVPRASTYTSRGAL